MRTCNAGFDGCLCCAMCHTARTRDNVSVCVVIGLRAADFRCAALCVTAGFNLTRQSETPRYDWGKLQDSGA